MADERGSVAGGRQIPRWEGLPRQISVETCCYLLFGLLALLTRFYNLGYQALHHDESLHADFSWLYYVGAGYTHDPLMHGPFLFHLTALAYLLFGDSDATARFAPALFGAAIVLLPWFLRRELGRWGALSASLLLLMSPSILYFGRFERHDIFSAFLTLLLFVAIVRYVASRRPAWAITGAAAWGFLFTNKEDFFIVTAIFGSALVVALLWSVSRRTFWYGVSFVALCAVVIKVLPKIFRWQPYPKIPWENPTGDAVRNYVITFLTQPVSLIFIILVIGFCGIGYQQLREDAGEVGLVEGLFGRWPAGTPMAAARSLLSDRTLLLVALLCFAGIYIVLYTSFFTNPGGIFTGSFGAIFYWLGQQDVRRAEQPWFYYLLLLPQYDPLPALLGGAGVLLTGWRLVMHRLRGWAEGPHPFIAGLMAYWAVATVAIYSWAGEKMPWMDVHLVLPLLLIAAALIGRLVERVLTRLRDTSGAVQLPPAERLLIAGILVALAGWFFGIARLSAAGAAASGPRWWLLLLPALVILMLAGWHGRARGWGRTGPTVVLALTAALLLYQVHAGWALSFQHGDVPEDMLVYVQTSPDVPRFMRELDEFSALKSGGKNLTIMYDDNSSWPFQWYLRDYSHRQFFSCSTGGCSLTDTPGEDVVIVLVGNENLILHPELATILGASYVPQQYAMRWHFPENETYRPFAIAPELGPGLSAWTMQNQPHDPLAVVKSVLSSFGATAQPDGQARLFRLLVYRELGAPLGSYDFTVYVRKDLLPEFNAIRYR